MPRQPNHAVAVRGIFLGRFAIRSAGPKPWPCRPTTAWRCVPWPSAPQAGWTTTPSTAPLQATARRFQLPTRRFGGQDPCVQHPRVVGPQAIDDAVRQMARQIFKRAVAHIPFGTHHRHTRHAPGFEGMFGDGLLWQVILKFTRVHHPYPTYLRKTMGKHLIVGASGQLGIELMLGRNNATGSMLCFSRTSGPRRIPKRQKHVHRSRRHRLGRPTRHSGRP